jgi:hypothetical protein
LLAVTAETRGIKERANIFGVSEVLFVGGRREFAEVKVADVPFVSGQHRCAREGETKENA